MGGGGLSSKRRVTNSSSSEQQDTPTVCISYLRRIRQTWHPPSPERLCPSRTYIPCVPALLTHFRRSTVFPRVLVSALTVYPLTISRARATDSADQAIISMLTRV